MPRGRADRARQFMPFAALKGYYDLVSRQERVPEPRRGIADDDARMLSERLSQVQKGDTLRVTHYDKDAYLTQEGAVTRIDPTFRTLTLVRTTIRFDDIYKLDWL